MKAEEEKYVLGELDGLCLLFFDKAVFSRGLPPLSTVNTIQDRIDFLRIAIKYLIFDVEATKREGAK
jgi:hypothetical protein